jgi:hypothetical protein
LSDNDLEDCLRSSTDDGGGSCIHYRMLPASLQTLSLRGNKLTGHVSFGQECFHSNLTLVDLSSNKFTAADNLFATCMQSIFLNISSQENDISGFYCPLPTGGAAMILDVDVCTPDLTQLLLFIGILCGAVLWSVVLRLLRFHSKFHIRERLRKWMQSRRGRIAQFVFSVGILIVDTYFDIVLYVDMLNETNRAREQVGQKCAMWNTNMDISLRGVDSVDKGADRFRYRDISAFFKDPVLLQPITAVVDSKGEMRVVPLIRTASYFFDMVEGLDIFHYTVNNSTVLDTLMSHHESNCLGANTIYPLCYLDPASKDCKALDRNLFDDFLLLVYTSIAVVAVKELAKIIITLYLTCVNRTTEGVPRTLRHLVTKSLLSPLLLLAMSPSLYVDQLVMHVPTYQDHLVELFSEIILENLNQLFLGFYYLRYITQQGIDGFQLLIYPFTAAKFVLHLRRILQGMMKKEALRGGVIASTSVDGKELANANKIVDGGNDKVGNSETTPVEERDASSDPSIGTGLSNNAQLSSVVIVKSKRF